MSAVRDTNDSDAGYDLLNAVLRGIISAHGAGGGITGEVIPVQRELRVSSYTDLMRDVIQAVSDVGVTDGDIVVLTSSVVAMAQQRVVPIGTIPKDSGVRGKIPALMPISALEQCARQITDLYRLPCSTRDILLADTAQLGGEEVLLLGPERPNAVAFDLAARLLDARNIACDVVVKDSDAGGRSGTIVVGHPTLVATPLGATKGVSFVEAMRVAAAAEALMGKKNRIPIVLCRPANLVVRRRAGIGEERMTAYIDALQEPLCSSLDERV